MVDVVGAPTLENVARSTQFLASCSRLCVLILNSSWDSPTYKGVRNPGFQEISKIKAELLLGGEVAALRQMRNGKRECARLALTKVGANRNAASRFTQAGCAPPTTGQSTSMSKLSGSKTNRPEASPGRGTGRRIRSSLGKEGVDRKSRKRMVSLAFSNPFWRSLNRL
jgi:hypothetical protein